VAQSLKELRKEKLQFYNDNLPYKMTYYMDFDYSLLGEIQVKFRSGRGRKSSYNDVIIMADTETSKKPDIIDNHVVAWTISLRAYGRNLVTLYGNRPSELVFALTNISKSMGGDDTIVYFHNLQYDWTFIELFCFREWGFPLNQLNVRSHYPINIEFENGIIFKDSLILAQRSLDRWAKDMQVDHQKAIGKWDYDWTRNQGNRDSFNQDELEYIEHDTLAGVECIDKLRESLHKHVGQMPMTATGIPREDIRKLGKKNHAREKFRNIVPDFETQRILERCFHGGYTHGNRHRKDMTIEGEIKCKDFASSYIFSMLRPQFPIGRFSKLDDKPASFVLENSDKYCFIFKLILVGVDLKDEFEGMPYLQFSKCISSINAVIDNGRILECEYCEIYCTEFDLMIIEEMYDYRKNIVTELQFARKGYLPKWFRQYIFSLYIDKCKLKGIDDILYSIQKSKLNSCYGMLATKPIKVNLMEDYETGEFYPEEEHDPEEIYDKYCKKPTSILPYQWGVYVTALSVYHLYKLGSCVDYANGGYWLYSDTDSCYSNKWDEEKVNQYNEWCKHEVIDSGFGSVKHNGKEYWLGVAEDDKTYAKFRYQGAKRYCGVYPDGTISITVAGVPKSGSKCLKSIDDFEKGFVFDGETTGKLTHQYIYVDDIYVDGNGNETGNSINLIPCDYLLDSSDIINYDLIEHIRREVPLGYYG